MKTKYTTRDFIRCCLLTAGSIGAALNTNTVNAQTVENTKQITARITYYTADRKYGTKVACSKTKRATEGVTIAAHPDFKFGTEIHIPSLEGKIGNGRFLVQDRGTAVTSKKASRGRAYVFDIYVKTHSKVQQFARNTPQYIKIYVKTP
jgi:3D (Asp-Asp-Asp) domain-containing protein